MIYTRPDYFSEFTCIADKCPDTCCAGWQIVIDEESLEKYKKIKHSKERKVMEKTLKTEGIMCMHCEARVKKCLEAIDGVTEATASHETGLVTVKLAKDVPTDTLKSAIEAEGYKVIE